jgi:hypothetical protein
METLDDQTVAYVLATHTPFEDLKQVAAQLAGLLVLSAAGASNASCDHPLLSTAEQLHRAAEHAVRGAKVTTRARMHHHHLLLAVARLDQALSSARVAGDPLLQLESAYAELRSASRALPGFEMMSFERGCCA